MKRDPQNTEKRLTKHYKRDLQTFERPCEIQKDIDLYILTKETSQTTLGVDVSEMARFLLDFFLVVVLPSSAYYVCIYIYMYIYMYMCICI